MLWALLAVIAVAASCIYVARQRSSRAAVVLTSITGLLWVVGVLIFWISGFIYPDNPPQREMSEWKGVVPIAAAIPMSFVSFVYFLVGSRTRKEA